MQQRIKLSSQVFRSSSEAYTKRVINVTSVQYKLQLK